MSYQLETPPPRTANFGLSLDTWTGTGIECFQSNADCTNCPIHQAYGRHKDHIESDLRCHQPRANSLLVEKQIPIPDSYQPKEKNRPTKPRKNPEKAPNILMEQSVHLRQEIVRLLPMLEVPSVQPIVDALNQAAFMEQQWTYNSIQHHMQRMCAAGVIRQSGKKGHIKLFVVKDASQLANMSKHALALHIKSSPNKRR